MALMQLPVGLFSAALDRGGFADCCFDPPELQTAPLPLQQIKRQVRRAGPESDACVAGVKRGVEGRPGLMDCCYVVSVAL